MNHLKSYNTLLILTLVALLLHPATAQRRQDSQRSNGFVRGPQQQVRRAAPRQQVRRSAPRPRMQRSAPRRQVQRSAPPQQVRRSAPRQQGRRAVGRSAPNRQRSYSRNTTHNRRPTFSRNQNRQHNANRGRFTNRVRQDSNQRQTFVRNNRNNQQNHQQVVRQPRNQNVVREHNRHRRQRVVRQNSGNRTQFVNNANPGRRHRNRQNFINRPTTTYVNNTRPVRRPVAVGNTYNVNRNVVVNQPGCAPVYTNTYNPVIYTNYNARRRYRRSFYRSCPITFLSLGFFLTRPYSYYDYARVGYNYNTPYYYGDENYYRPNPYTQGGPNPEQQPVADANTSDQVAAALPNPQSSEHQMLAVLSEFVDGRSKDGRYQLKDAAFNNQTWQLELSQAPAVYEISDGKYSVVAGFEGTLGASSVPSQVTVEFFMVKAGTGYAVRDAWITNANGIARNKLYQSPDFPSVQTWQPGKLCPFTGKPMIEIPSPTESKPQPKHG